MYYPGMHPGTEGIKHPLALGWFSRNAQIRDEHALPVGLVLATPATVNVKYVDTRGIEVP